MLDSYRREINYLRISVTDRCNLRCRYSMPSEGFRWIPHENILRFEEIIEIVREAVKLGIHKIKGDRWRAFTSKGNCKPNRDVSQHRRGTRPFHDDQWNSSGKICPRIKTSWIAAYQYQPRYCQC